MGSPKFWEYRGEAPPKISALPTRAFPLGGPGGVEKFSLAPFCSVTLGSPPPL